MQKWAFLGVGALFTVMILSGLYSRLGVASGTQSVPTSNRLLRGDVDLDGEYTFLGDVLPVAEIAFGVTPAPAPFIIPLDENGHLAVHEQGVVEVRQASGPGTLRTIFSGEPSGGEEFATEIVNVEDCDRQMVLFAVRAAPFDNLIAYDPSPDGSTAYLDGMNPIHPTTPGFAGWLAANNINAFLDVSGHNLGSHLRFRIRNGSAQQHVTIQLYCR
jgi:hypothetical protein